MAVKGKEKFDIGAFLLGILFIILSIIAFNNPIADLLGLTYYFGFVAIIKGFICIFDKGAADRGEKRLRHDVLLGIVDIIIGLLILFNIFTTAVLIVYLFSIWFIVDCVIGLINIGRAKRISTAYYWFSLVVNVIGILIGIALFFNPLVSFLTIAFLIGLYFLIMGINYLVLAF